MVLTQVAKSIVTDSIKGRIKVIGMGGKVSSLELIHRT